MSDEIIVKLLRTDNPDDIKIGLNLLLNQYNTAEELENFLKINGKPLIEKVFTNPICNYFIPRGDLNSNYYIYLARGSMAVSIGGYGVVFLKRDSEDNRLDF